jgi:hypothetical protein
LGDGIDGYNYCIVPLKGWLVKVGNDGAPASKYPLKRCEGDCDSDADCESNLVCRQRSAYEVVPGCQGLGAEAFDYCGPVRGRVVAIGDLHGVGHATRNALLLTGIVDEKDDWIGGTTKVVQCCDQTDRGSTERETLDLFEKLRFQAEAAGGAFYPLIGNHEVLNINLDFSHVAKPGGFDEFADVDYDLRSQ